MTVYLDCEFDGFNGPLISMALVSTDGEKFYEVLRDTAEDPWVRENVIPILNKDPIAQVEFRSKLAQFLIRHENETIIADFPCDFRYLLQMITEPMGVCLKVELNMQLIHGIETYPWNRHNALSDAEALLIAHRERQFTIAEGKPI